MVPEVHRPWHWFATANNPPTPPAYQVSTVFYLANGIVQADEARTGIYPAGNVPIAPYTPGIKTGNSFLYVSGQIPYVSGLS